MNESGKELQSVFSYGQQSYVVNINIFLFSILHSMTPNVCFWICESVMTHDCYQSVITVTIVITY